MTYVCGGGGGRVLGIWMGGGVNNDLVVLLQGEIITSKQDIINLILQLDVWDLTYLEHKVEYWNLN